MPSRKTIHQIATYSLFCLLILTGVLYVVYYDVMVLYFKRYGYPTYLIYPLVGAKIIGSFVILKSKNRLLVDFTYAGFFFNFVLAFFVHLMVRELDPFPTISLVLLLTSYFTRGNTS